MAHARHILAIDQGTTSSRAILFDDRGQMLGDAQKELPQHFPKLRLGRARRRGHLGDTLETARGAIDKAGLSARDVAAIGITNQRETALIWDRETGEPIHRAICWQDRRGAPLCDKLRHGGHERLIQYRTGLIIDPTSPPPRSSGCWRTSRARGRRPRPASSPSGRSIPSCCGG